MARNTTPTPDRGYERPVIGDDWAQAWDFLVEDLDAEGLYDDTDSGSLGVGTRAAKNNSGSNVTASGFRTAESNTGDDVTASGFQCAQFNTKDDVTASGFQCAQSNEGKNVTASGFKAAEKNTGANLTVSGREAARGDGLADPTTMGDDNIGIGVDAIRNNQASGLIAIGRDAGINAQTDDQLIITDRSGNRRMVMDLTTGDLKIEGTLTENVSL
jgi:hypothetical protein